MDTCPQCHASTQPLWYFCPDCGKQLRERVLPISLGRQILIYGVSFFLAPLGIVWGIRYIRSSDPKTRVIGWVSILLTVVAIGITISIYSGVISAYSKMLNNLSIGRY